MASRQMCASVLATMPAAQKPQSFLTKYVREASERCKEYPENAREFRKKDGVEAMRDEVVHPLKSPDALIHVTGGGLPTWGDHGQPSLLQPLRRGLRVELGLQPSQTHN